MILKNIMSILVMTSMLALTSVAIVTSLCRYIPR